ncbi:ribonuclease H family protein [Candidatus Poriferisodalis sp.]|uniref:ribonuclease H family protein n=1 Tax=Candidatus Poriferisodalis sp. TaxID=3101277 RepID=UPI003B01A561
MSQQPNGSALEVFTDGSCLGNPGPGGWAYVVDGGPWASGYEPSATNQRMEVAAAAQAVADLDGPLRVVSDSTYVVKCFTDEWWKGWHRRNWLNSARKPVANRDLWEPFIDAVLSRGDVTFAWVKGHAGQRLNSAADLLAVAAAGAREGRSGRRFSDDVLDQLVDPRTRECAGAAGAAAERAARDSRPESAGGRSRGRTSGSPNRANREITGHVLAILGHRPPELGGYDENSTSRRVLRRLSDVLAAKRQMHPDLLVATGLGLGAETLGAEAALAAGVPYVAVLAFEGVERRWRGPARRRFAELRGRAMREFVLSAAAPIDGEAFGKAMRRRDTWFLRNCDEAILVRRADDRSLADLHRRLEEALDDVMVVEPD